MDRGKVVIESEMESKVLASKRMVRVYVPGSYGSGGAKRYPVLYAHDGQNVFSTVGPHVGFGWGNWDLDGTASRLAAKGLMQEIIIVAVDCSRDRYLEYRGPSRPYTEAQLAGMARQPSAPGDDRRYRAYERFLIDELKPRIDREFRTDPLPRHTALLGSSMGGICSLALAWHNPNHFGGAASMSGAFQVEREFFLREVLKNNFIGSTRPRIYLDSGVMDHSGGDDGRALTQAVAQRLRSLGWRENENLLHHVEEKPLTEVGMQEAGLHRSKWKEAAASQHNEFYWKLRVERPLLFLFGVQR